MSPDQAIIESLEIHHAEAIKIAIEGVAEELRRHGSKTSVSEIVTKGFIMGALSQFQYPLQP